MPSEASRPGVAAEVDVEAGPASAGREASPTLVLLVLRSMCGRDEVLPEDERGNALLGEAPSLPGVSRLAADDERDTA